MTRARVSIGPPAANGTTMVTGRDGKVCAGAGFEPTMASVAARKAPTISRRRVISASSHATVSPIIISLFIRLIESRSRRPPPYPPPLAGEGREGAGCTLFRAAQRTFLHQGQRHQ